MPVAGVGSLADVWQTWQASDFDALETTVAFERTEVKARRLETRVRAISVSTSVVTVPTILEGSPRSGQGLRCRAGTSRFAR